MTTIYDTVLSLPRSHRLALASWIIRTNHTKAVELQRLVGRTSQPGYAKRRRDISNPQTPSKDKP